MVGQSMMAVACWAMFAGGVVAQFDSGGGAESPFNTGPPQMESSVYRIEHAESDYVARFLNEMLAGTPTRVVSDARNNSVHVEFVPELKAKIEGLIKQVDTPPEPETVCIYNVRYAPASSAAMMLQTVMADQGMVFAVDAAGNRIVVKGNDALQAGVQKLLEQFDAPTAAKPKGQSPTDATAVRVRAIWLANGPHTEGMSAPPDDLSEVVAELAEIGVDVLRQVGQSIVNTTTDGQFELTCSPQLATESGNESINWAIKGTFVPNDGKGNVPRLKVELKALGTVGHGGAGAARGIFGRAPGAAVLASIQTDVTTPFGHHIVLCATPTGEMTSVFVIQVTRLD
jgi:hypothetical protein